MSAEKKRTPDEIDAGMAEIDGFLGAAGHRIDDHGDREILRRQVAGDITSDEARVLVLERLGLS